MEYIKPMCHDKQKPAWWNKPIVQPGTAWWNRPIAGEQPSRFSPEVWKAVQGNLGLQFVLMLLASLILDGGFIASIVGFAAGAWWIAVAPILLRRPKTTSRGELLFLRIGFVLFLPLSLISTPLWGWLRAFQR